MAQYILHQSCLQTTASNGPDMTGVPEDPNIYFNILKRFSVRNYRTEWKNNCKYQGMAATMQTFIWVLCIFAMLI